MFKNITALLVSIALLAPTVSLGQQRKQDTRLAQLMSMTEDQKPKVYTYADGAIDGKRGADQATTSRAATGIIVGALTGLIGTGIGYFVIGPDRVPSQLAIEIAKKGPEYHLGFNEAYEKQTKRKKRSSFCKGGLGGIALFVIVHAIVVAQQDER